MSERRSALVCQRCGLAVYGWMGPEGSTVYKHAAVPHARSCGKSPVVVERVAWEAELDQLSNSVADMLRERRAQ